PRPQPADSLRGSDECPRYPFPSPLMGQLAATGFEAPLPTTTLQSAFLVAAVLLAGAGLVWPRRTWAASVVNRWAPAPGQRLL
ncbi:MAG: hypothetical protein ACRDTD_01100, partial [Pseudonocardiaceae bacterium]